MNRPTGITIIAVLMFVGGALSVIGGIVMLAFAPFWGIITLATGAVLIAVAVGAWQLKAWAWMAALGIQGWSALLNIINLFRGASLFTTIFSLAINAIVIYYLLRPEIRAAFRH